jgi:EmrB/QacA subfamily drug resistance transporter
LADVAGVDRSAMAKWRPLAVLAAAQFLMVLDAAVMNVSISQLVDDFDTDVTTIQGVITLYALVMASLMLAGAKLGDIWGRRRAFQIGMVVYACGSLLTALSWNVLALTVGWSVLEGVGAALVMPALVALAAASYQGAERATAYGVLGGMAGVGIAVGPILGGWVTTTYTWRLVFAGEVVVALAILASAGLLARPERDPRQRLDWLGAFLSASGLGLFVFAVLKASSWGWIFPRDSPVELFGFSLAPFVAAAGVGLLLGFTSWERHRATRGKARLVDLGLLRKSMLQSGLTSFLTQNMVLMGVFFAIPLYLQVVQGYDALDTGIRMLPVSAALFLSALGGARLSGRWAARPIVQVGFGIVLVAIVLLLSTIDPKINDFAFGVAMAMLGIGLGLVSSQLGNVVQSAVSAHERSEAGGLQYTSQQLGSALGTALIGAIVISLLIAAFDANVAKDPQIAEPVKKQVGIALEGNVSFVSSDAVEQASTEAGVDPATTATLVEHYENAQLTSLKTGLLVAGFIVVAGFFATGRLPTQRFSEIAASEATAPAVAR